MVLSPSSPRPSQCLSPPKCHSIDVLCTGKIPSSSSLPSSCASPPAWCTTPAHIVRLEPVNAGSENSCSPIDLSGSGFLKIGRSVKSDVQMSEITVSRKHAVILHHACGDTFLVDVGSAHGTYVNNVRVPANSPYRLRRGSLLRFGGCQAPLFLFKAFERLERLLEDVNALASEDPNGSEDGQDGQVSDIVKVVCGDSGVVCVSCNSNGEITKDEAGLATETLVNTLLNAGGGEVDQHCANCSGESTKRAFHASPSFPPFPSKKRRTASSEEGMVQTVSSSSSFSSTSSVPSLEHTNTPPPPKKVMFSTDPPSVFYPAPITPEDGNSDTSSDQGDETVDMDVDHVVTSVPPPPGASDDETGSSDESTDEPTPPPSPPQLAHKVPSSDSLSTS
mmetsp:Transcript_21678/g.45229  ORF Transcript_21678/g.45229 Transcript_21678/m.45229 type:complete len:392 (+) Transcript_21678:325-1500(+)|eukprot:CAMPEP_0197551658 /NCGR_PEP_ID=MMETSP1320-20131121/5193_1 /TAXON_ID=91990 /ORGANISM="Bolidomonas sp., Strain RCC2347" /LENGTH=391 /DNA_ID=CAMNT_0043112187 /DNA_START=303 /DNA_END=1478 /DNA_ORIENTATION=-